MMFEKEVRDKLIAQLNFNNVEPKNENPKGDDLKNNKPYSIRSLYRALKVDFDNTKCFRIVLDVKLENLLTSSMEDNLRNLLSDNIMEFTDKKFINLDDAVTEIDIYLNHIRRGLKFGRNNNFHSIKQEWVLLNEFMLVYCKYLGGTSGFTKLYDAKEKIIKVLEKLGYQICESKVFNNIKYYYDYNSKEIAAQDVLKENRGKSLSISMEIAEVLMKKQSLNINLLELLSVDEDSKAENLKPIEVQDPIDEKNISEEERKAEQIEPLETNPSIELEKKIVKLQEELEINRLIHRDEKAKLVDEITMLRKEKLESLEYAKYQYKRALETTIKALNDKNYGSILDEIYKYSKGYITNINDKAIIKNLLVALQSIGIRPIEKHKVNTNIFLDSEDIYNFRFSKTVEDIMGKEATLKAPAWFYNNEELIKELIEVKEC